MTASAEVTPGYVPAGFWRRGLAALCDASLLLTAALVLFMELLAALTLAERYGWVSLEAPEEHLLVWVLLGSLWWLTVFVLPPVFYFTVCEGAFGQTFGKGLFSLVVISAEGRPIGYGRTFARLLALPYSVGPAGLGLLWGALPLQNAPGMITSAPRASCVRFRRVVTAAAG